MYTFPQGKFVIVQICNELSKIAVLAKVFIISVYANFPWGKECWRGWRGRFSVAHVARVFSPLGCRAGKPCA